jgi:hypothetical protein
VFSVLLFLQTKKCMITVTGCFRTESLELWDKFRVNAGGLKFEIKDIDFILNQPAGTKHKKRGVWTPYLHHKERRLQFGCG